MVQDKGEELGAQIEETIRRSGWGGYLAARRHGEAIVTPTFVQVVFELRILDPAEPSPRPAYLEIKERCSPANLRERIEYWYGLVDNRVDGETYYEGFHFHDDPPQHPVPYHHHQLEINGVKRRSRMGAVTLPEAIGTLLQVYWRRSDS